MSVVPIDQRRPPVTSLFDSFRNLLAGLGVEGRDKSISHEPWLNQLTQNPKHLESLYRSDWLSRKIVDVPAFDATRAWRAWQAEQDQIEALEETERQFGLQRKLLDALIKSRLYGGAAIILGVKGQDFRKELNLDTVGKGGLAFVHVVEKWTLSAGPRVRDIMSPWFGEPEYYMRSNVPIVGAPGGVERLETYNFGGVGSGDAIYIHPSRVVRLIGLDYPDDEHAPDVWGDSVLQPVYDAIRDAGLVSSALANMVADSKVDVYRIPGLTSTLSTQAGTQKLLSYLSNANVAKSMINSLVLDKEIEWQRIQTKFEGMPQVLQAFLTIGAAAADIPATRLLGREPTGMNATGESDTRNYYDRLHADQEVRLTPLLSNLDELLIRHTFGKRDPDIYYEWNSLWQMSDSEKATIALQKAQAYKIDVDTGLISPDVLRKGRENQLIEDGTYPGLEAAIDEEEAAQAAEMDVEEYNSELGMQPSEEEPLEEETSDALPSALGALRKLTDENQSALGFEVSQATNRGKRSRQRRRRRAASSSDEEAESTRDAAWEEEKHPRGHGGKFGEGSGGEKQTESKGSGGGPQGEEKEKATISAKLLARGYPQREISGLSTSELRSVLESEEEENPHGFTRAEEKKLRTWTSGSRAGLKRLQTDPGTAAILAKMPVYKGMVYRGLMLKPQERDQLKLGKTFTFDRHNSASTKEDTATGFFVPEQFGVKRVNNEATLFQIKTASGRRIPEKYAGEWADESEVIIPKGTQFKITGVSTKTERTELSGKPVTLQTKVVKMQEVRAAKL